MWIKKNIPLYEVGLQALATHGRGKGMQGGEGASAGRSYPPAFPNRRLGGLPPFALAQEIPITAGDLTGFLGECSLTGQVLTGHYHR